MADFELEQLKTLFQNLADRLSHTRGDEQTVAKLALLEKTLARLANKIGEHDSTKIPDTRAEAAKFTKEFLDELKRIAPAAQPNNLGNGNGNSAGPGQGRLNIDFEPSVGKAKGGFLALAGAALGASKAIGNFSGRVADTADKFRNMDGSFGSLATAMGLGSGAIGVFAKVLDGNVNAYRAVQNSAEGSISGFEQMHQAMLTSITTTSEFADAMTKGSDGVRLLGGIEWAKFNSEFRKATREVGFLSLSLSQIRDAQSAYLDIAKNQGMLFDLDQAQLVKGMTELVKNSKDTASILGKNREDMQKQIADQSLDANFQAFLKSLGYNPKEIGEINSVMASLPAEMQAIVKESSSLNGGFSDMEKAQKSAIIQGTPMGDFQNQLIEAIYSKRAGGDKFISDQLGQFQRAGKDADVQQGGLAARLFSAGSESFGYVNRMNQAGAMLKPKELADRQKEDQKKNATIEADPGKIAALRAEETIKGMAATLDASINRVFDTSLKQFGGELLSSVNSINGWNEALKSSIPSINSLGGALGTTAALTASVVAVSTLASLAAGAVGMVGIKVAKGVGLGLYDIAGTIAKKTGSLFNSSAKAAGSAEAAATAAGSAASAAEGAAAGVAKTAENAAESAGKAITDAAADAAKPAADAAKPGEAKVDPAKPAPAEPAKPGDAAKPTPAEPAKPGATDAAKPTPADPAKAAPAEPATNTAKPTPDPTAKPAPAEPIKPGATNAATGAADAAADAAGAMGKASAMMNAAEKAAALAKKLGPLAYILQGAQTYGELTDLNAKHEAKEIDDDTFKKEFSKSIARALGGVGGGILGAELGAGLGAAGGTMVAPGPGTLFGGLGGAVAGGIAGSFGGSMMADQLTEGLMKLILAKTPAVPTPAPADPQRASTTTATPPTPNVDQLAQARNSVEVPLTARDIKQPFENLQTAMVAQLELSNKYLEAIRDLIRINNDLTKEGNVTNVQSLTDLQRMLEDAARANRMQTIY